MSFKLLFQYHLDGSITNGTFLEIRLQEKDILIFLCKNSYGNRINNGIHLSKNLISLLLNLPSGGFYLNDCTNIKIGDTMYNLSRYKEHEDDIIKFTQTFNNEKISIYLPTDIYSSRFRFFLKKIKILYDFRELADILEETIIEAIIYTIFENLRKRLFCDACVQDKDKNFCSSKETISSLASQLIIGFGDCDDEQCLVIKKELNFINEIFNYQFNLKKPKEVEKILSKLIKNEKTENFKQGTFFKLIKFLFN
ncbi:MAG: hypothetical protein QM535_17615 [Limnohabitans sp.]|nr:hypothetical protein [Limnohabitans sp.]